jgi:hypothetical protein
MICNPWLIMPLFFIRVEQDQLLVSPKVAGHGQEFVSDLGQVSGFLWVLWFPPPIKLTAMI